MLCLDEQGFVSDITDAMVLGTVFDALFRRGVALVTTSNIEPSEIYMKVGYSEIDSCQRSQLIQRHCEILNLSTGTDYRLRTLRIRDSITHHATGTLPRLFGIRYPALVPEATKIEGAFVTINRRQIAVRFVAEDVVWFDFDIVAGWARRCLTTSKLQSYIIRWLSQSSSIIWGMR